MDSRRSVRVAVAAAVATVLLGCGLSPSEEDDPNRYLDPASTVDTPDPCTLLTPDEVGQARGAVGLPGKETRGNENGERVCAFDIKDSAAITNVRVQLGSQFKFDSEYDVIKSTDPLAERVPGIGDDAFYTSSAVFYVLKGKFMIVVVALGIETAEKTRAVLVELAKKATGRLS